MFCMKCGRRIFDGEAFCKSCGTKVWCAAQTETPVEVTEEKPVEPDVLTVAEEAPVESEPEVVPTVEETPSAPEPEAGSIAEETPKEPVELMSARENEYCTNCDTRLPAEALFCLNCGEKTARVEAVTCDEETAKLGIAVAPTQTSGTANNEGETEKVKKKSPKSREKRKKKKFLIVGAAVVLFAVIIGAIVATEFFSYACADCQNMVYFEEHIIPSADGEGGRGVCEECRNEWQEGRF